MERAQEALESRPGNQLAENLLGLTFYAQQRFAEARRMRLANRTHALAASLRGMGAGAQPPLFERLGGIALPICLVVGAEDAKFRAIASELARDLPNARIEIVPDAGHAAHLENREVFLSIARRFLAGVDTREIVPHSAADAATQHSTRTL